ncbi:PAS domain S-box-containing protein [Allochromatium warmingii]|uniref:histidine kinase n=1 Tax=Allochromatium warmingii TaxID=61595 RepID=A0A1H3G7D4_ALLWA|nr:HAMP domain-containing sensor histidine kinase [Allochromatium warmingii]SDX98960.1 PAS domain S-box-containing protein [Allochromatium warmingii]
MLSIWPPVSLRRVPKRLQRVLQRLRRHRSPPPPPSPCPCHLKTTLDQVRDSVLTFDPDTLRLTYVNQSAVKQLGYNAATLLTMRPFDFKPDFDEAHFRALVGPLQRGELSELRFETRHRHRDGHDIPVEIFMQYLAPTNQPARYVSVVRDIAERQTYEAQLAQQIRELRELEARLQRSQTFAKIGSWEWDIASGTLYWSERIAPMFGYDDLSIQPSYALFLAAIYPDDREAVQQAIRACLEQNQDYDIEHRVLWPNGELRWLHERGNVIRAADGTPLKMLGVAQDVTERRQLQDASTQANQAKSAFLARMTHELRTPLNAILGFAQVLAHSRREPLSERQADQLHYIENSGRHLLELIDGILELVEAQSESSPPIVEPIALDDVVHDCLAELSDHANERSITLHYQPAGAAVCLRIDHQRFRQVLRHLLSNAIQYNHDGGRVQLTWRPVANQRQRLEVHDTGPGIAAQDYEAIFEPFNRLQADQAAIAGMGIGLALARERMARLGGQIGVDSVLGQGSTFWIEWPLTRPATDVI